MIAVMIETIVLSRYSIWWHWFKSQPHPSLVIEHLGIDLNSLFEKSFEILLILILCVWVFAYIDVCVACMQCLGG